MKILKKLIRWIADDWWVPVEKDGLWGIYHPRLYHTWSYEMTYNQAKSECDKLNNRLADPEQQEE